MMVSRHNFIRSARPVLHRAGPFVLLITASMSVYQSGHADEQDDAWFDTDRELQTQSVNEGALEIFKQPPEDNIHIHRNSISIDESSMTDGWVDMDQCHSNLDAVSALQIVFNKQRVDGLEVVSYTNIEKARVENNTIQLENIKKDSRLCLRARTKALRSEGDKLILKNGPFMRRFLDGYYPVRVQMHVIYPAEIIRFIDSSPVPVTKQSRSGDTGELDIDVIFSGELTTEFVFTIVK